MSRKFVFFLVLPIIITIITSCYPDNEIYPEETDTVYTTYLPGTNFGDMKYYLMADSVLRLGSMGLFGNSQYDNLVLDRIEQNLRLRGFENAAGQDSSGVDFMVVVSDLSHLDIIYYWAWLPYGYLYPNYAYDELNAFYPLPPPTNILVGARTGILVDILEYNFDQQSDTSNVYWRGLSDGVQSSYMEYRIISNIDKMFVQSPNLKSFK